MRPAVLVSSWTISFLVTGLKWCPTYFRESTSQSFTEKCMHEFNIYIMHVGFV